MKSFRHLPKSELDRLPKSPGVYSLNAGKEILYIGKAANLRSRVKNHFQQPSYRDNLFVHQVDRIGYRETPSDIDALLLESELIKKEQPRYNVMWRDDKKYFYAAITKQEFPRVFVTHQPATSTKKPAEPESERAEYIGPFVDGKSLKRALRVLRSVFPYYTARKHPKLPCPYCHLGLCPGPNPDKAEYRKNVRNLAAVLKGKRRSVLANLKRQMKEAAQNRLYEKAALLRDQIAALERVASHSSILAAPRTGEKEAGPSLGRELQAVLGTEKEVVRAEAYDISNIQGNEATGSQVVFVGGTPAKSEYRKYKIRIAGMPNDFAMMQELVSRRMRHREWPYPDLAVIDGGKGQLSAARKAIEGEPPFALAALAKQREELFLPGRKEPLRLDALSPRVRNFFLHIRDEAHRFAITYHRTLMAKRD